MNVAVVKSKKQTSVHKIFTLSDKQIVNRLIVFPRQAEQKGVELQAIIPRTQLYRDLDASLHELHEVLEGKKQVKSFQQFLDEI